MRTKKLFICVIAAVTLLYSSGCCDTQSCYTVQTSPCNPCVQPVRCTPNKVRCRPAPVAVECPPVVDCPPAKPKKVRRVKKRYANCMQPTAHCYYEVDPCAGNPPLLIQSIAPAAIVVASPSSVLECPPPPAPVKVAECLPAKVQKKPRGRTRTIIPVINNNVSATCGNVPAMPTYTATTYAVNMTNMQAQPVYLPDRQIVETPARESDRKAGRAARKQEKIEAKLEPKPEPLPEAKVEARLEPIPDAVVEALPAPKPAPRVESKPEPRIEPVYEQRPVGSDRSGPPLLNDTSMVTPPAPSMAAPRAPALASAPATPALEPIPYASPLATAPAPRQASEQIPFTTPLASARGAIAAPARPADPFMPVMPPPAARPVSQMPPRMPQGQVAGYQTPQGQYVAGQQIQPGQVVEPWMLQPREQVTASGFEPGVLPGCPPASVGCPPSTVGCPPSAAPYATPCAPAPCPPAVAPVAYPPANCPPEICPPAYAPVCQPGQNMSECFSMNDQQLMTGPQVYTPNAMTPLPIAAPTAMPQLSVPGQVQAPAAPALPQAQAPRAEPQGKYEALLPPAPQAQDFGRAEPRPNELSMPAPLGGNIPPVAPASEIENALDAMLFRDSTM